MNVVTRALVTMGLLGSATLLALPAAPVVAQAEPPLPAYAPGQVIVQFKAEANMAQREEALAQAVAAVRERIHTPAMQAEGAPGLMVAATRRPVPEAVRLLSAHPAVEFAEPNWIFRHTATSNDPYYTGGYLWGTYGDGTSPTNSYGSGAGEAWANGHTGADTVYVGVIDEGVQTSHPDLQANVWTNPFEPVDGVDNDGNGYVDDVHGWDFYHRDNTVYDTGEDHHGTHVAGTIGARGGNGTGVTGVAWNVRLISAKFLGQDGGYLSDAVKAVDYFTNLKRRHGLNIVATNNSWGGGGYSQAMHDAVIRAAKQNILFIAAAGNGGRDGVGDNNDTTASYPSNYDTSRGTSTEAAAGYDAVVAVAAIDRY
ncbi:MAG: putative peptidase and in, kexin, sedolisin precursor, partial [Armatimonadetes bacterium]|nr:putative peptidase and in, kexin, sedolisin precursor [Armatimonadota bacterium]